MYTKVIQLYRYICLSFFKFVSYFSSVQFSCSVVSDSLQLHESQHARPPCPSPTPRVHSNSCPSSWWCHPAVSSSVVPFSSCPQSLPESGSFPMSHLFTWGGQSTEVSASASVLPMNTQDGPGASTNVNWLLLDLTVETKSNPKSLQMVTAAMKLKDSYSLEEKLWPT